MELKTIKSKTEFGRNEALKQFLSDGWSIARKRYEKVIDGQRYFYTDIVKEEPKNINEELDNE